MSEYFPNSNWCIDESDNPHEADFLKLDIEKADKMLGWKPSWNLKLALKKIIEWHNAFNQNQNMLDHTLKDIIQYENDLLQK
jgi:CDP-glucose 4,6-dehydratase